MGKLFELFTPLHKRTTRDYAGRMADDKIHCMQVAKQYGYDYWDGDRRYGYGGYRYDGRWGVVAERLIEHYQLGPDARILDVGCGKAFLLYELMTRLPEGRVAGFDISTYGLEHAKEEMAPFLFEHDAAKPYPYADKSFDLVISLGTLHNLGLPDLKRALNEIERVGKQSFVMAEAFRSDAELYNLQCWALTCETFMRPENWVWFFDEVGYSGDYEFIYFE
ncbi:MAG TPA: class I SAM-dependent methyltransferase [Rhodocyclaceae bacterium]|jgi:SAM-dependent methyltransferase|nr:class I SAM-dependent methyltransferase [Rhodocyclaceae bacterium]